VTRLSFIGKKAEFVTCGGDGQVKFFNAKTAANVRILLRGSDFIYAIGVAPTAPS